VGRIKVSELVFIFPKIDVNDFINTLKKDKKNIDSQIRVILTRGFGRMFIAPLEVNHELADWLGEYFETHS